MVYQVGLPYQAHTNAYFEWDSVPRHVEYFGLSTNRALTALPSEATRQHGKQTPDVFPMPGLNAVNARFRELVEKFEPGKHFFHPIVLKEKDGSKIEGEFYIFCARVSLDCVLTIRSGIEWKRDSLDTLPYPSFEFHDWETHHPSHQKSKAKQREKQQKIIDASPRPFPVRKPEHLYVSARTVAGHHLWTGDNLFSRKLWVSDEFFAAFEKAKLKWLRSFAYGFELDEPWSAQQEMAPLLEWRRSQN